VVAVLLPWAVARAVFVVGWLGAALVADRLVPGASPVQLDQGLFAWDGAFYREIVERGYGGADPTAIRFFPLLPWLAAPFELIGIGDVALVVIACAASLAALAALRALTLSVTDGDEHAASGTVWCAALVPGAFTWAMPYAESLLVLAVAVLALAVRRDRWWLAAGCGFAAALSRPLGVLVLVIVIVELVTRRRRPSWPQLAALAGPIAGWVVVLLNAWLTVDDATAPLTVQEPLRGDLVDPLTRTFRALGDVVGDQSMADGLHTLFLVGAIVLLVLAAFRTHEVPVSLAWHGAAVATVAVSAENLNSLERYLVSAPVFALTMALVVRRPEHRTAAIAVLGAITAVLVMLSFTGVYVP
jgi:hypothetical protein